MAYESSTTYLLKRLPHAVLYYYDGRWIKFFNMKLFVDRSLITSFL